VIEGDSHAEFEIDREPLQTRLQPDFLDARVEEPGTADDVGIRPDEAGSGGPANSMNCFG